MLTPDEISLYIPVRNAARTLAAAIASVQRQSLTPTDIFLLVDTRSRDESVSIARSSGLRVVEQHDGRLGHARNLALQACKTRWLASCDADVTLETDWLARLAARATGDVAIVGGCTHEMLLTAGDRWRAVNMPHNWGAAPLDNPFMLVSEMLADTRALRSIGGYRADLQSWEDSDCCQRLRHAGYGLRYEPGAVAWHDRRDTIEQVLDLRWFYASYRQKQRFESIPGLIEKLATNRTYCLQSLSQSLHSVHADTCGVALALWFHHARRDLVAALEQWPLLTSASRAACMDRLRSALEEALVGEWAPFLSRLTELLPVAWRATASFTAARGLVSGSSFVPTIDAYERARQTAPELSETRGFHEYLSMVKTRTIALLREVPAPLRAVVLASAERLTALERGDGRPPDFAPPQLETNSDDRAALQAQDVKPAWNSMSLTSALREAGAPLASKTRVLEWGRALATEKFDPQTLKRDETAPWLVLLPHLEDAVNPRATLEAALAAADWAVVAYQSPAVFLTSVPIVAARDLATWSAAAGFEIRQFQTEAGLTRLVLRRSPARRVPVAASEMSIAEVEVR